ncbi:hypothetical protein HaLaN_32402, partial [Haematococcus lacustris]
MPHHLRPLPFASPRHNAAVQARLAYGELLSKMAPALEDAEAAAAFPKPWASLVDPAQLHTDASAQAMGTYLAALKGPVFRDRHDTLAAVQRMMAGEPQP